jgi:hypothetical protein
VEEAGVRAILGAMFRPWICSGWALVLGACGGGDGSAAVSRADGPAERAGANAERRSSLRDDLRRALGGSYDEPLAFVDEHLLARGERAWELHCSACHGLSGRGGTTLARALPVEPGDLADPRRASFFSERAKLWILAEGSAGTPMTGWKEALDERMLIAVLAHMRTLVRPTPAGTEEVGR